MPGQKIRIKLKSYDHILIDKSTEKIIKTVKRAGFEGLKRNIRFVTDM